MFANAFLSFGLRGSQCRLLIPDRLTNRSNGLHLLSSYNEQLQPDCVTPKFSLDRSKVAQLCETMPSSRSQHG